MSPLSPSLRRRAMQAVLGGIPFDRLLVNGRVIDMVTGEIRAADIGIVGPFIASVHPRGQFRAARSVDCLTERLVAPELIDTHVHVESVHLLPAHYAQTVVAQGTTTIFWDPHELANVLGMVGVPLCSGQKPRTASAGDHQCALQRTFNAGAGVRRCAERQAHRSSLPRSARCGIASLPGRGGIGS